MGFLIYSYQLDLIAYALLVLVLAGWVHRRVRRHTGGVGLSRRVWLVLALTQAIALSLAVLAGRHEHVRLETMVSGIAPTYAAELHLAGLPEITVETPADDPTYLRLIEMQKRWLALNPNVADIYTFGRTESGVVLLVDSETDYDRNGLIEGETEARTAIGEPYEESAEALAKAFSGVGFFDPEPTRDRWGTWVCAYAPVRNDAGEVYSVIGVDYAADSWIASILVHRCGVLLLGTVVLGIQLSMTASNALLRNETARRAQAESALRRSEARLRAIVDNEPECVAVVDRDGVLLEINPAGARMAQAPVEELRGQRFCDLIHPDHREAFIAHHQRVLRGEAGMVEFALVGAGDAGHTLWLETHSVPLADPNGLTTVVLSVARDVTARKQAEAEREALQRKLVDASRRAGMAEVATGVLHNVGNALNSVNVSASLCSDVIRNSKIASLSKAAGLIHEHADRAAEFFAGDPRGRAMPEYLLKLSEHLVNEQNTIARELAQLSQGIEHIKEIVRTQQTYAKQVTVVQPIEPSLIVEDALMVALPSLERHDIQIAREIEPLPQFLLDKHKIMQVLVNLLSNAKHAVVGAGKDEPRLITIALRHDEPAGQLVFAVRDNGIGIAPENMERIFRHGFTTRREGHGFGLHSAANAAREMGGELSARSDGPGCGAEFTLRVPARTADAAWKEAA